MIAKTTQSQYRPAISHSGFVLNAWARYSHKKVALMISQIESAEEWNDVFKFGSVRNPHERFVSDFKQFFSKEKRNFKEAGYAMGDYSVSNFHKWMENIWYPFISDE